MPCSSEYPSESLLYANNQNDTLTRLLCAACKELEKLKGKEPKDRELRHWWRKHKAWDARRIAQEKILRERKQLIEMAKNKLTKEERKLLGVD
jgi:hypothetical protein